MGAALAIQEDLTSEPVGIAARRSRRVGASASVRQHGQPIPIKALLSMASHNRKYPIICHILQIRGKPASLWHKLTLPLCHSDTFLLRKSLI